MYGMVNKAIEEMVCMHHGEEMWERIMSKSGVDVDVFISNEDDILKTTPNRPRTIGMRFSYKF